jgi:hypothetical protein
MSEFGDPLSVQRLAGGVFGSEGLLTAKVREQPFSVLLLDEFEKAHPLFLDLLLQVLGEGRLTDAAGRLADFTNTVIILTSNLGAESFQQGAFGFAGGDGVAREAAREHFTRAVQAFVRPELFNRIDRLVPFAPLDADVIRRIARRHLGRLEARDGIRYRGVTLGIGAGVAEHLARAGFDARYGARPLLRAVERELLAPMAHQMNRYGADFALSADVRMEDGALRCVVKPRLDAAGRPLSASTGTAALAEAAEKIVDLRRRVQALMRCRSLREFQNELYQLEREQERFEKAQLRHAAWMARLAQAPEAVRRQAHDQAPRVRPAEQRRMTTLAQLRQTAEKLRELMTQTADLEDRTLLGLHTGDRSTNLGDLSAAAGPLEKSWEDLLLTLYLREFPQSDRVTLSLFAEDTDWLAELATAYVAAAEDMGLAVGMVAYLFPAASKTPRESAGKEPAENEASTDEDAEPPRHLWRADSLIVAAVGRQPEREVLVRKPVRDIGAYLAEPPARLPGVALHLRGSGAAPRFMAEAGLHLLRSSRQPQPTPCLVESSDAALLEYLPPPGITRRGAIGTQPRRRTYDRGMEILDDAALAAKLPWQNQPLPEVLAAAITLRLRRAMLALLEE